MPDGSWGEPRRIYSTESQILNPDIAIGEEGRVLAAWEHHGCAILASTSTLDTEEWSEPLAVRVEGGVELPDARFTADGTPLVTFGRFGSSGRLASELELPANTWSEPRELVGDPPLLSSGFSSVDGRFDILAADGLAPVPSLPLGVCEGY